MRVGMLRRCSIMRAGEGGDFELDEDEKFGEGGNFTEETTRVRGAIM